MNAGIHASRRNARHLKARRDRVFIAGLAALFAASLGSAALAQQGPIVINQRQATQFLTLSDIHAAAEFKYRSQSDSIKSIGQPKTTFGEDRFEETLEVRGDGAIVHPNLVTFTFDVTGGLIQQSFDNNGEPESNNGYTNEYDLEATILRKEVAPVTLYARRTEDFVNRQFGPSLDNTITTEGAAWEIRAKTVPTRLEAFHSEQEQTGLGGADILGGSDFSLNQNAFLWHSEYRPSDRQTWQWDYTFNDVHQSTQGFGSDNYLVHDATLSHSLDFGDHNQNNLSSSINYFNQGGEQSIERLHWVELLHLRHTNNFETRYQYTLDRQSFLGVEQTQQRGDVGFLHRLYQSLTTTGDVGVQHLDRSDNANTRETFANLNLDYRKLVPLGRLNLFGGYLWDLADNTARSEPTQIVDVPGTFNDSLPILIVGNGIVPGSVVVTDARGLVVYQPGLDYTIDSAPDNIQLRRVVGGRIAEGQTVLIDYVLSPQAANTVTTNTFSFGGRYDFERGPLRGVGVYGHYIEQQQTIESDVPQDFTPNSFIDTLVGADYRIWDFQLGAERQWHDATISPYNANRYFGRFVRRVAVDTTLMLNTSFVQIDYLDENNHADLLTVSGNVQHQLTRDLFIGGDVIWRDENDELRGKTFGLEELIEVRWTHRQTTAYGRFRNSNLDTDTTDTNFQFLEIGIRREF